MFHADKKLVGLFTVAGTLGFLAVLASPWGILFLLLGTVLGFAIGELF